MKDGIASLLTYQRVLVRYKHLEWVFFYVLLTEHLSIFIVLLTVHLSIFISVINQLDAHNFCITVSLFHASICFEHHVFIIRRSKLHYVAIICNCYWN